MSARVGSETKMERERRRNEMMTWRGQGGLKKERRGEIKHKAKVMCGPQRVVEGWAWGARG